MILWTDPGIPNARARIPISTSKNTIIVLQYANLVLRVPYTRVSCAGDTLCQRQGRGIAVWRRNVWKPRMSIYERVGRIILFPVKLGICLIVLPFAVLAYPLVAVYIMFTSEYPLKERVVVAVTWPLAILVMNDFLSLGGLNNRALSRVSDWLHDRFRH